MKTTDLIQQLELSVIAAEEQEARGVEGSIYMDAGSGRALLDALKRQARGDPDECLPILREALAVLKKVPSCSVGNCDECALMCWKAADKLETLLPEINEPPTGGNNDGT